MDALLDRVSDKLLRLCRHSVVIGIDREALRGGDKQEIYPVAQNSFEQFGDDGLLLGLHGEPVAVLKLNGVSCEKPGSLCYGDLAPTIVARRRLASCTAQFSDYDQSLWILRFLGKRPRSKEFLSGKHSFHG